MDGTGVRWKPLTYSNFVLSASRDFVEEEGYFIGGIDGESALGGWGDLMEYRAAWNHEWDDRIRSSLIYNVGEEDYAGGLREDEFWDVALQIHYAARPWLSFSASAQHSDRESNLEGYSYDENVYTLGFDMTFY